MDEKDLWYPRSSMRQADRSAPFFGCLPAEKFLAFASPLRGRGPINFADDELNPPVLRILDRAKQHVPQRAVRPEAHAEVRRQRFALVLVLLVVLGRAGKLRNRTEQPLFYTSIRVKNCSCVLILNNSGCARVHQNQLCHSSTSTSTRTI